MDICTVLGGEWQKYLSVLLFFCPECKALVHLDNTKAEGIKKQVGPWEMREGMRRQENRRRGWQGREGRRKNRKHYTVNLKALTTIEHRRSNHKVFISNVFHLTCTISQIYILVHFVLLLFAVFKLLHFIFIQTLNLLPFQIKSPLVFQ